MFAALLATTSSLPAQQDPFRWMDFHNQKDQDVITWVTRAIDAKNTPPFARSASV